jgi:hypothetical protein
MRMVLQLEGSVPGSNPGTALGTGARRFFCKLQTSTRASPFGAYFAGCIRCANMMHVPSSQCCSTRHFPLGVAAFAHNSFINDGRACGADPRADPGFEHAAQKFRAGGVALPHDGTFESLTQP